MDDPYKKKKYNHYTYDLMDHPIEYRRSKKNRRYIQKRARQQIRKDLRDDTQPEK